MNDLKLPVGVDSFEKIRCDGYYYVDKTGIISTLLSSGNEVTLFTRPRRFGKTLTMRMLQSFFEVGRDRSLFDGLEVASDSKLCEVHQGKYPVVFLTLKDVDGMSFESAMRSFAVTIRYEAQRIFEQIGADDVPDYLQESFKRLVYGKADQNDLSDSLRLLSGVLFSFYQRKVILLIDEYDVPLDKAFNQGYYDEMVSFMRGFFGQALKSNEFLQQAVLTGCLRISKESIFTGLNNFYVDSIVENRFNEYFGFTDEEVREMLACYGVESRYELVREWYDG